MWLVTWYDLLTDERLTVNFKNAVLAELFYLDGLNDPYMTDVILSEVIR